jgi:hypothetical protein
MNFLLLLVPISMFEFSVYSVSLWLIFLAESSAESK